MVGVFQTLLRDLPPARPLALGLWTTAAVAAKTLLEAGCGEALVLDDDRPLGVVTTRGLARLLARHRDEAPHLAVRDVMDPVAVAAKEDFLPAALRHLLAAPSRRLAVVDAKGRAVGILAPYHVVRALGDGDELAGRTVAQAMARAVVTARADEEVSLVLGRMSRAAVGGVVVGEDDRPLGMFTSRDAVARLADGLETRGARVAGLMRTPVVTIAPQLTLPEALASMDGAGAGRLAVTDADGLLLGVLTWTDVTKALCAVLTEAEENRHREQADLFRDLYDNAPLGLFRLDLEGRPLAANTTLAAMLGFADAGRFMREAGEAVHPLRLDLPERRDLLIEVFSSPTPVRFETRVYHNDGSTGRIVCVLRATRDALGAPAYLDGACVEQVGIVPAREEGYRSIVEHQTELVCRYDPQGRLTLANAAFARYWGTTPEACVAGDFRPDIPEEDQALVAGRIAALTPLRPTTGFEHRVVRPDGRLRWQRWIWRAIFDAQGTLVEYQAVGRDITGRKLAEERLRSQCLFAQTLIEAMPAPVYFRDAKGRYQGCNKAFESLLGVPRERLLGQDVHAFHPEALADIYAQKDRELLRRGGRQVYETSLDTVAGMRHVLVRKSVFHDVDGKAAGVIGVVLDITDRKQAEAAATKVRDDLEAGLARHAGELREANRRLVAEVAERQRIEVQLRRNTLFLETVLNAIQDGLCVLSPDLAILKVNDAMRSMYADRGEPEGRHCYEIYRGLDAPCEHCPTLRALATGKLAIGVVSKFEAGQEVGWIELYCYPLFGEDGAVTGVTEIVRDVTTRKKLEAELADALERAEAGSQAKGAFLANMSHEIRTPLNAVLGYVQLMLHDHLEPRQRERLTVVEESAGTLLSIINDILDYSKIEAGRLEIKEEPFDLVRCLEAVVKEQEVLARDKGLELLLVCEPGLPRTVRGDGLRLRQILRNLVNNAVKYTEKGQVTVSAGPEDASGPGQEAPGRVLLRFSVVDTGMGIPEAEQATVFDSFTQVEGGLTRRQAGTGLGLAICRRLAGLMGGVISMKSRPGRGSVFWLICPFDAATPLAPAQGRHLPEPAASRLRRLRVLLVEDNRVNRVFATDLLASRGHEVVTADDGRAALDYLSEHAVDLVLMDIQMPVMDGLTATRAIRAGHLGIDPGLPVVGLSAYAMDQERERFLAAGLDDYVTKPFIEEELFAVARRVLARRGRVPVLPAEREAPVGCGASLDTERLDCQYRDKTKLFSRVAREFLASVPQQLETLEAAVRVDDLVVCERVAHTLKGNAAMFGAGVMRAVAAKAEEAAAQGDTAAVRALAEDLGQACRMVLVDMGAYLERLGG
jgi:PAS domain S-box-containing protein